MAAPTHQKRKRTTSKRKPATSTPEDVVTKTLPAEATNQPVVAGVFNHTRVTAATLRAEWKLLARVILPIWLLLALLTLKSALEEYAGVRGAAAEIGEPFTSIFVYLSVLGGILTSGLGEMQQMQSVALYLVLALTVVWLVRHRLAGDTVRARDGLYNSLAPLVALLVIAAVAIVQLLPAVLAITTLALVSQLGVLANVFVLIIAGLLTLLLCAVSLYWLSATVIAAVIVTIPGAYPMLALRSASDLLKGHRLAIIRHIIWLLVLSALILAAVLLLPVLLDSAAGGGLAAPLVLLYQLANLCVVAIVVTYVFMLYRRIIDAKRI
ncbi:MAG TPA: hypothetical protein VF597_02170 [Candidatus Saccharimonadales bacterium]|jgi:hypothetical protein